MGRFCFSLLQTDRAYIGKPVIVKTRDLLSLVWGVKFYVDPQVQEVLTIHGHYHQAMAKLILNIGWTDTHVTLDSYHRSLQ